MPNQRPLGQPRLAPSPTRLCSLIGVISGFAAAALLTDSGAHAFPTYLEAFELRYPGSTLTTRVQTQTGSKCSTCHVPEGTFYNGNCFRLDLKKQLQLGLDIEQALAAIEPLDSDGDGVPNRAEILRPRVEPGAQVGYSPGLNGPDGKDGCVGGPLGQNPVTNQSETPCLADANFDAALSIDDFIAFQTQFSLGDDLADINFDGTLSIDDFIDFQTLFVLGCATF